MAQGTASSSSSSMDTESSAPQCSICLEVVVDNHRRSTARLQCGHVFHLDCIGSEFNIKGAMQCPNCRVTEHGKWLFAAGGFDQSIDNEDDDELHPLNMNPPAPQEPEWSPFNGYSEAPPAWGGGIYIHTPSASNPLVYHWNGHQMATGYPMHGHQMATGYQMPSSMNDNNIQPHQQTWIPQPPFPSMGNSNNNNITAINQSFNSPPILEFSGTFSYRSPTPLSSAPPAISNHWSAPAGAWGFTGTSSGLPYPGSNVGPPLTWPRIPSRPFQSNSPSPAVLASMSRRRRNPGNRRFMNQTRPSPASVADEQTSGFTMFPSSELSGNNAPNQVSLPRGSTMPDHGMQLWNTPESMPPEYQTDDEEEEEDDEEEEE